MPQEECFSQLTQHLTFDSHLLTSMWNYCMLPYVKYFFLPIRAPTCHSSLNVSYVGNIGITLCVECKFGKIFLVIRISFAYSDIPGFVGFV